MVLLKEKENLTFYSHYRHDGLQELEKKVRRLNGNSVLTLQRKPAWYPYILDVFLTFTHQSIHLLHPAIEGSGGARRVFGVSACGCQWGAGHLMQSVAERSTKRLRVGCKPDIRRRQKRRCWWCWMRLQSSGTKNICRSAQAGVSIGKISMRYSAICKTIYSIRSGGSRVSPGSTVERSSW